jgi:hypothetical protein
VTRRKKKFCKILNLVASMRSQLRSSRPSLSSGLIQPQVSSSNAQSPELDEATWGEAVDKGEKQNCQFNKVKGGLT